jgi:ribonuclease HI
MGVMREFDGFAAVYPGATLLHVVQHVQEKAEALHVFSDSEVMVKQKSGEYSCRSPRLYSLNWTCRKLAGSLDFSISHVPRESNTEANRLASSAARNAE